MIAAEKERSKAIYVALEPAVGSLMYLILYVNIEKAIRLVWIRDTSCLLFPIHST